MATVFRPAIITAIPSARLPPPWKPPNLLADGLLAAPFAQIDWPLPLGFRPLEERAHLRSAQTQLIGLDRFFGAPGQGPAYDWPNPTLAPPDVTPRTWTQALAAYLPAPVVSTAVYFRGFIGNIAKMTEQP